MTSGLFFALIFDKRQIRGYRQPMSRKCTVRLVKVGRQRQYITERRSKIIDWRAGVTTSHVEITLSSKSPPKHLTNAT